MSFGNKKEFKSNYILRAICNDFNPFTPNVIAMDENELEFRKRNWHLFSVDSENLRFENIVGITVDKHLFGATLQIKSSGNDPIIAKGFSKGKADKIKEKASQHISENTQKNSTEAVADAVSQALGDAQGGGGQKSVSEELKSLKELLEDGTITQEEFEQQKQNLMNDS